MKSESATSAPSSHGQMSMVFALRRPGVTRSAGSRRYDARPSVSASSACILKPSLCSGTVGPEP